LSRHFDLAPGTEAHRLARAFADRVREGVSRDAARARVFDRLAGSVAIIADDAPTTLTLRFDFGRLTIHDGVIGVPDVTLRGHEAALEALGEARVVPVLGAPIVRGVTIYGLLRHPRLVARVLYVLARSGE
jgi:hypothetical protein